MPAGTSRSAARSRSARARTRASKKSHSPSSAATLRTADGHSFDIKSGDALDRAALAWSYIARHRIRLQRTADAREDLADRSSSALGLLGVDPDALAVLASSRLVEVSIPFSKRSDNWAARVMPWEALISWAIVQEGASSPLIIRHLVTDQPPRLPRRRSTRAAVVLGAVDALTDDYSFDTERTLASRTLDIRTTTFEDLTQAQLQKSIRSLSPDVIHVGGVDVHQGADFFELGDIEQFDDGVVLIDEEQRPVAVAAYDFARSLTSGRKNKPSLVAFNLYYSAARTAALTVAQGAAAAIGFQDRFDDLVAELFLGELYRAWTASGGDPLVSFYVAWLALMEASATKPGSGVVLWSARSLVGIGMKELARRADAIRKELARHRTDAVSFREKHDAANALDVKIRPLERLNYGLMHNRGPMFEAFEIRNRDERRRVDGVQVEVELFAGTERLPYCTTLVVDNAPVSVDDKVFIPLTSSLVRSLKESVRASLRVKVSIGPHEGVFEDSYRVTLLPTDEWVDNDPDRQWLPSFVLPQDPAVDQILAAARPYLTFLADSPSAGFDGYQSIDPDAEDPNQGVDWQVEAIWSALCAVPLGYINPPPTYSEQSQRLRFPSRILKSGDGTCIDLALFMASCLEQVNIYPVVFLLDDHAFPGYWRSDTSWDEFINMRNVEALRAEAIEKLTEKSGTVDQQYPWVFPAPFHAEIMKQIEKGNLVPLETVWITTRSKFAEAQDTGWENLLKPSEFCGLVDITLAREFDVTPLPYREEGV